MSLGSSFSIFHTEILSLLRKPLNFEILSPCYLVLTVERGTCEGMMMIPIVCQKFLHYVEMRLDAIKKSFEFPLKR